MKLCLASRLPTFFVVHTPIYMSHLTSAPLYLILTSVLESLRTLNPLVYSYPRFRYPLLPRIPALVSCDYVLVSVLRFHSSDAGRIARTHSSQCAFDVIPFALSNSHMIRHTLLLGKSMKSADARQGEPNPMFGARRSRVAKATLPAEVPGPRKRSVG